MRSQIYLDGLRGATGVHTVTLPFLDEDIYDDIFEVTGV